MPPNNWIDDVLSEFSDVETPRSWIYWSLLCAIAASAASNYTLVAFKGKVTYLPNLYVILLGKSGLGKKLPVDLAANLVRESATTRVIYGRSSIQAVVQEASRAQTREGKSPILDARMFIVNGELSTAIIEDPDSLTILTDIYDHHKEWINKLKGDGNEKLKNTATTCLFGSSPAHFYDSIPQVNIEGGYIGRNLVISEEARWKDLDMFGDDELESFFPFEKYKAHLEAIGSSGGRIVPDSSAKEVLNLWRRKWREHEVDDVTGFLPRVPDHVIKVAMCLCLAEYDKTLIITAEHILQAIEKVTGLEYGAKKATEGLGSDPLSRQTKMVLDFLVTAPGNELKRKQLLVKGYGHYNSVVLDTIINDLAEKDWITKIRLPAGKNSDWIIRLRGEPLAAYKKFLASRKKKTDETG